MASLSLDVALALVEAPDPFPVDFDDVVEWLGYSSKQKGEEALRANFIEGEDFLTSRLKSPTGGRPAKLIQTTIECVKMMGMMAGTEKGREIRRYFLECEKIAKARAINAGSESMRIRELELEIRLAELKLEAARLQQSPQPAHQSTVVVVSRRKTAPPSPIAMQQILSVLKDDRELTAEEIAQLSKLSESYVRRALAAASKQKLVRRRFWNSQHRGRKGYVYLKANGTN